MRILSVKIRCRTSFLVRARYAPVISFSRPSNCGARRSTILFLRVSAACSRVVLVGDRHDLAQFHSGRFGNGGVHVVGVVDEDRELSDRLRELRCQLGLGVAQGL